MATSNRNRPWMQTLWFVEFRSRKDTYWILWDFHGHKTRASAMLDRDLLAKRNPRDVWRIVAYDRRKR